MTDFRGSRKHVLDLADAPDGVARINGLVTGTGFMVRDGTVLRPLGHTNPKEWTLRQYGRVFLPDGWDRAAFDAWWVAEQYKGPTWDLLARGQVDGRDGLLLVEAKAHEGELDPKGKRPPDATKPQSQANDARIRAAITEACDGLRALVPGVTISADDHYQLSNRVATAYTLAARGLPVVLLYLGFTGDRYFTRDYLIDDEQWQSVMLAYTRGILPWDLVGRRITHSSGAPLTILVRSLPVIEVST